MVALVCAPAAGAAVPSVLGGDVSCAEQPDGTRYCGGAQSVVPTFDSVPIDVNVALPPASGGDGNYPLVMVFHGYGGRKLGFESLRRWTDRGYAAFSMSTRGFGDSCGLLSPTRITHAVECLSGYVRLMDTRYEVRDAQLFAGMLADEGIVNPQRVGATGGSYGGGMSMALAALKDRTMMPDGSLVPWVSPGGKPMRIAAAAPGIPWSDLAYSLVPNGHTLDYVTDSPYLARGRVGVMKESFDTLLLASGQVSGYYAPPLLDDDADLFTWYALLTLGEPYDINPLTTDIVDEVTSHHSSYYIDHSQPPAPLLISNGWTDDLFPADEAIRFYNRTRAEHPGAEIALSFLDYGHMRGQGKGDDVAWLRERENAWFAHYLKGQGAKPSNEVRALTQTCPKSSPSGGPFSGQTWATIAPGEIRYSSDPEKTILPLISNPLVSLSFDPATSPGACATTDSADDPVSASYRLAPAPEGGFTMLGSPTVIADISSISPTSQIAGRLLDVAPNGQQTLVARGLYRPEIGAEKTRQVFQLHPNGYRFEPGHVAKLELLPNDIPYGRISNLQLPVSVSNLELRLPVVEQPGSLGGLVGSPAGKVLPDGYELSRDYLPGPAPVTPQQQSPATPKKKKAKRKCGKRKTKKARRKCRRAKRRK